MDRKENNQNWYYHPIYLAAAAVGATITLGTVVVSQLIIPAHLAAANFQIEQAQREKGLSDSQIEGIQSELLAASQAAEREASKLAAMTKLAEDRAQQIKEYQLGNLFIRDDPYPRDFGWVKVGEHIDAARKHFSGNPIKEFDGYITIDVDHAFFSTVTYYYFEETKKVYQIAFRADYRLKISDDFLNQRLTYAYGLARQIGEKHFVWMNLPDVIIFKDDRDSFIVASEDVVPGGWERVVMRYNAEQIEKEKKMGMSPAPDPATDPKP